jgi:hypothetical protein
LARSLVLEGPRSLRLDDEDRPAGLDPRPRARKLATTLRAAAAIKIALTDEGGDR